MTCVVGVVQDGVVYVGADSASVSGQYLNVLTRRKVFRLDDMLIGVAGSLRLAQLVRYRLLSSKPPHRADLDTEAFLATDFMDALRQCLKDGGHVQVSNTSDEETDSSLLVGYRGRLFTIDETFTVCETQCGYIAIGSGQEPAMGALFATHDEDPMARLVIALHAAEAFNTCVRGPFTYECLSAQTTAHQDVVPVGWLSSKCLP
ncbi:MAG TPA: hypothetical protein VKQ30_01160 [Ktedonobacterales bacterium]|nr:hypothetical protein [Ktedonobacterales bacterium]